jgi:hypothetical protein
MKETKKPWDSSWLLRPFKNAEKIKHNYGQSDQDIFVLSLLDGLENGTYLELGAGWPEHISNTALLERQFNWSGISIDNLDEQKLSWQQAERTLSFVNALTVDFSKLLSDMPKVIDYLSVDCDDVSLDIVKRLPLDLYKFKVITFEHDCYVDGPKTKYESREFLTSQGYQLVVNNISQIGTAVDYEDWWCRPELVDPDRLHQHLNVNESIKNYRDYLYK